MKTFIRRVLKSMGVLTVLKEHEVISYLTYYRMDFRDIYGNYITFDIFYNDTDLFSEDLLYIGMGNEYTLSDCIRSRCKVIGDLKDYLSMEKKIPTSEELDEFFVNSISTLTDRISSIKVKNVIVRKVTFYTTPTLMVFIHLNYKLKRVPPIKIFIGQDHNYKFNTEVDLFLEKLEEVIKC